jgi:hypothetical protein
VLDNPSLTLRRSEVISSFGTQRTPVAPHIPFAPTP